MRRGPTSIFDHDAREQTAKASLASWYLPGLSDGLGDRLLMFDNTDSPSLELLRFKKEFSSKPAFEEALRQRIRQVERLIHPAIGKVRALKWLADNEGLALVSDHVAGRRLSEVIHDARGQGFAMELIRQLTPALVALQQQGDGIAHGVLTPERIVVTPEGNLVIVEHVLGPAVELLDLPAARLRNELGLALPKGDSVEVLNGRGDVVQLGMIALSLVMGRRIDPADYPHNVSSLLDDFPRMAGRGSSSSPPLRLWLEQALQLRTGAFGSAEDAYVALAGLPEDPGPRPDPRRIMFFRPAEPPPPPGPDVKPELIPPFPTVRPTERQKRMPAAKWPHHREGATPAKSIFERVLGRTPAPVSPPPDPNSVGPFEIDGQVRLYPVAQPSIAPRPAPKALPALAPEPPHLQRPSVHWVTRTVAGIALGEGLFIAGLLYARPAPAAGTVLIETTQPGVEVLVDGRRALELDDLEDARHRPAGHGGDVELLAPRGHLAHELEEHRDAARVDELEPREVDDEATRLARQGRDHAIAGHRGLRDVQLARDAGDHDVAALLDFETDKPVSHRGPPPRSTHAPVAP